uniref:Uncharacterized protein n=1 Tax=Siphoviridae sp. ctbQZ1 TaxID=2827581 RepID=A0A8S5LNF1_9CAUD|nr:MAG TPA: hypothetical protein [Siphoviridae sp. ctbQZ1]
MRNNYGRKYGSIYTGKTGNEYTTFLLYEPVHRAYGT